MTLLYRHPAVATRDCDDCMNFIYDERTGKRQQVAGRPVKRPAGVQPPCQRCPKVSPTAGVALSEKNAQAYRHYLQCKGVRQFPDDPLVGQNAGIIRAVEDSWDRSSRNSLIQAVTLLVSLLRRTLRHG